MAETGEPPSERLLFVQQGEGEVKLIQRLVNPFDGSGPGDSYAIIGSDSDLFIMALLQEPYPNLWILPEGEVGTGSGNIMEGFTTNALSEQWGRPSLETDKVSLTAYCA